MNALMLKASDALSTSTVGNMDANIGKEPEESNIQNARYIRCPDCGEEIMMVPVLAQMIEAIETHISTHRDQPRTEIVHPQIKAPNLREDLTEQVLQRAADISSVLNKNENWINHE